MRFQARCGPLRLLTRFIIFPVRMWDYLLWLKGLYDFSAFSHSTLGGGISVCMLKNCDHVTSTFFRVTWICGT